MRLRTRVIAWLTYLALASVAGYYAWVMVIHPERFGGRAYDNPLIQQTIEEAVRSGAIMVDTEERVVYDRERVPPWCRAAVERYIRKGYIRSHNGKLIIENNLSRRFNPLSGRGRRVFLRGSILDRDGVPLASSVVRDYRPRRQWLDAEAFFHVLGRPGARFISFGLEKACNETLSSLESPLIDRARLFQMETVAGKDIASTLDETIQLTAYRAFKGRPGAAVVIDIRTDGILAAVSVPSMRLDAEEPEWFSAHDDGEDGVLLNRAFNGLYPPGSTFKTIIATAALETNRAVPNLPMMCPGYYQPLATSDFRIKDHELREDPNWTGHNPHSRVGFDVGEAFAESCNVTFARLGVSIGRDGLDEWTRRFGFYEPIEIVTGVEARPIKTATSVVWSPRARSYRAQQLRGGITNTHVAQAAIGQSDVRATPLQMAIVAAAVANGGELCAPRLVRNAKRGKWGFWNDISAPGRERSRVMEPETAAMLRDWMARVVDHGSAAHLRRADLPMAGKTGTAQTATGAAHGWFIGFAPVDEPKIAFAVVVEHAGYGSTSAAPIALEIVKAYKEKQAARPVAGDDATTATP